MSIFENEQAPTWMLECFERLGKSLGAMSAARREAFTRVLGRKTYGERHVRRAVELAEERWDKWRAPSEFLMLCAEVFDRADEKVSEESCADHWRRSLRGWQGALDRARQREDAYANRVADKSIDKCYAAIERLGQPADEGEIERMRASIDREAQRVPTSDLPRRADFTCGFLPGGGGV